MIGRRSGQRVAECVIHNIDRAQLLDLGRSLLNTVHLSAVVAYAGADIKGARQCFIQAFVGDNHVQITAC